MPAQLNHQRQAEQNERLARGLILLSPPFMEWAVTACFYAALHLIDGYFARHGIHPQNHQERRAFILRAHYPIRNAYRTLERYSLDARYNCVQTDSMSAFQPAEVELLLDTELQFIKNYLAGLP
ncbi:hypothetical protein HYR99_41310 [Candidatus Poribacteria bacterium]|nr:hypothetical protein [Candidatus Poribacteria bacterium]